jgi:predicted CXXCH cytochrome family protein
MHHFSSRCKKISLKPHFSGNLRHPLCISFCAIVMFRPDIFKSLRARFHKIRQRIGLFAYWRAVVGIFAVSWIAAVGFFSSSCSSVGPHSVFTPPQVEGAGFVGNKTCAECHSDYSRHFDSSPHARLHISDVNAPGGIGCESCHGPGSLHVKAGGGRQLIVNPRKNSEACFNCHIEQHAEFNLPQHHPVLENRMNCVQCHDPHGSDIFKPASGLGFARKNQSCAECHREQTRLFIYEHDAMREGCAICHVPHGSINEKMLVQRDNNLCLKCHAQVPVAGGEIFIGDTPHTAFLQRGGCWTSGCHTAVHGSNIDRQLRF